MLDLAQLNPAQRRAVTATEGPLLVVAGPGSGKTAVIAGRAAYLIEHQQVVPPRVLAVTFTNRAGRELRRWLAAAIGKSADQIWAGTFHAFALRLLRRWGARLGLDPTRLSIYADADDRRAALRQALRDLGRDPASEDLDGCLAAIGRAKGRLLAPAAAPSGDPGMGAIYRAYEAVLRSRNALDFDDFLLLAVRLLEEHSDIRDEVQRRHRSVLVDEFQDVNEAQHRLLMLLAGSQHNVCAVGDPLQNLFSWRGSDVRYLLDFTHHHPQAAVLALEQCYRSTQTLLAAANALGGHLRYGRRRLWTANPPGPPIVVLTAPDPRAEAAAITAEIGSLLRTGALGSPADCAILYRTNAQSRELELACVAAGLPYRVRSEGTSLGRPAVRDVLAYLRLAHNPRDTAALGRIINTPPRRLADLARRIEAGEPLDLETLMRDGPPVVHGTGSRDGLRDFLTTMAELRARADGPPAAIVDAAVERTGYGAWLAGRTDGDRRLAHLDALRTLAERSDASDLASFLDELALAADVEQSTMAEALTLATIHAAKGLEWQVVFVAGVEEGLLPHARTMDRSTAGEVELEEELRLCYVALTRAAERIYLTAAHRRTGAEGLQPATPSRFLRCIPDNLLEHWAC
jgi:DNA helicase-2/ATP-dependent DNA helicase PcrA